MKKQEFESRLQAILRSRGLLESEIKRSTDFYLEMIDDRIEDGMTEEEAVAAIGDIEKIAEDILFDAPLGVLVKSKIHKEKEKTSSAHNGVMLALIIILTFPVWLPILATLFGVAVAVFAVIFALIIAAFAVVISLLIAGIAFIPTGLFVGTFTTAGTLAMIGSGLLLIGISLLLFIPAKYAVKGLIKLMDMIVRGIKSLFIGKRS